MAGMRRFALTLAKLPRCCASSWRLIKPLPSALAEKAEAAPALLSVADESGLPALRAIALDWLVHNYAAAAATPAFQALSKPQSDMIAASACSLLGRYHDLLHSLAHVDSLPSPSKPE